MRRCPRSRCGGGIHSVVPSLRFLVPRTALNRRNSLPAKVLVDGLLANSDTNAACNFHAASARVRCACGTATVRAQNARRRRGYAGLSSRGEWFSVGFYCGNFAAPTPTTIGHRRADPRSQATRRCVSGWLNPAACPQLEHAAREPQGWTQSAEKPTPGIWGGSTQRRGPSKPPPLGSTTGAGPRLLRAGRGAGDRGDAELQRKCCPAVGLGAAPTTKSRTRPFE